MIDDQMIMADFKAGLGVKIPHLRRKRYTQAGLDRLIRTKGMQMDKLFSRATVKEIDAGEGKRELTGYASTECLDRDNELIRWNAWQLDKFMHNPVLCLAHDYKSLPVGRVISILPKKEGLTFRAKFPPPNVSEMSDTVWGLYESGVMTAFSCGFLPLSYSDNPHAKSGEPSRVYDSVKLLEISCVAVPSNPRSVVTAIEKAFGDYIIIDDDDDIEIVEDLFADLRKQGAKIGKELGDYIGLRLRQAMGRAF